jgi:hypothetical protein
LFRSEFLAIQKRLNDPDDLLELRKTKRAEGKKKSITLAAHALRGTNGRPVRGR